jgi:hypothetical protein
MHYAGTAATAMTATPVVDTRQSFTVAAWLYASSSSSTVAALGQDGTNESTFFLQAGAGHWMFCLPGVDATTWAASAGHCATAPGTLVLNQWTYVVGVWDSVNKQARISASTDGSVTTWSVVSHNSVPASVTGVVVGRNKVDGGYRYWTGDIGYPAVIQGVLSSAQISVMGQALQPPSQIPPALP